MVLTSPNQPPSVRATRCVGAPSEAGWPAGRLRRRCVPEPLPVQSRDVRSGPEWFGRRTLRWLQSAAGARSSERPPCWHADGCRPDPDIGRSYRRVRSARGRSRPGRRGDRTRLPGVRDSSGGAPHPAGADDHADLCARGSGLDTPFRCTRDGSHRRLSVDHGRPRTDRRVARCPRRPQRADRCAGRRVRGCHQCLPARRPDRGRARRRTARCGRLRLAAAEHPQPSHWRRVGAADRQEPLGADRESV